MLEASQENSIKFGPVVSKEEVICINTMTTDDGKIVITEA
jgi:hypothetical protein